MTDMTQRYVRNCKVLDNVTVMLCFTDKALLTYSVGASIRRLLFVREQLDKQITHINLC